MWLLDTKTIQLRQYQNPIGLRYAILSHVWQKDEQTFQDVQALPLNEHRSQCISEKIRLCCDVALRDGFDLLWIDTCCIDKTSSSELSEAINSMYAWYANSTICYAYLYDVGDDDEDPTTDPSFFHLSKWFTRGWTLQELIAPSYIAFLSSSWSIIGTKHTLAQTIEEITGIPQDVLIHTRPLDEVSVARRMSWAAMRETTREEDRAYSLMGIFGVHMPTIYGEGNNAFRRLQEEILSRTADQTIFAWGTSAVGDPLSSFTYATRDRWPTDFPPHYLLASSPRDFRERTGITTIPYDQYASLLGQQSGQTKPPDFRMTSYGTRAELPLVPEAMHFSEKETLHYAILACQDEAQRVGVLLLRMQKHTYNQCYVGTYADHIGILNLSYFSASNYWRVIFVPMESVRVMSASAQMTDVNLYSFEPPSVRKPTLALVPMSATSAVPLFAFFIPKRLLTRMRQNHIEVDVDAMSSQDGVLLESSGSQTVELMDSLVLRITPHKTWGNIGLKAIIILTGERCYQHGCTVDRYHQLPLGVGTQCTSHHSCWLKVAIDVGPNDKSTSENVDDANKERLSSTMHYCSLRQTNGHTKCDYGHIPKEPTSQLLFEHEDGVVEIRLHLQQWEHFHRTRARMVFVLNVTAEGYGLYPKFKREIH